MSSPWVVFDCMVVAQAMISRHGPAARCCELVRASELQLAWSDYVLQEIRELPPKLPPRLGLAADKVEAFILELAPHARHMADVPEVFENPFDRDDSHYVNLALASGAKLITSRDRDLLRLMDDRLASGREFRSRFPELQVLTPDELLTMLRSRQEQ